MILILVPVLCALAGLAVYGGLRLTGAFPVITGGADTRREQSGRSWDSAPSGLRERVDEIPRGCLVGVIAAAAVWIVGWLVVLAVGLHLLS